MEIEEQRFTKPNGILIVDDDVPVGRTVERVVAQAVAKLNAGDKVEVLTVGRPEEAIKIIRGSAHVEQMLLITDGEMPNKFGDDLIIEAWAARGPDRLLACLCTGNRPRFADFLEATNILCIDKPIENAKLRELVRTFLEKLP
jgi:DNA-binding NtrC family response regulator